MSAVKVTGMQNPTQGDSVKSKSPNKSAGPAAPATIVYSYDNGDPTRVQELLANAKEPALNNEAYLEFRRGRLNEPPKMEEALRFCIKFTRNGTIMQSVTIRGPSGVEGTILAEELVIGGEKVMGVSPDTLVMGIRVLLGTPEHEFPKLFKLRGLGDAANVDNGKKTNPLFRYAPVETPADAVLADALRAAGGTEIALSNGFRFAYPIPMGNITENDLWNYYPINSRLKTGKVSGTQLQQFFERELENVFSKNTKRLFGGWVPRTSGLTFSFHAGRPEGRRIRDMRINGQPVQADRLYTLTSCEREGDLESTVCRMRDVMDVHVLDVDAHQAVRRYLKEHSPVTMGQPGRIVSLDISPAVRSQFIN